MIDSPDSGGVPADQHHTSSPFLREACAALWNAFRPQPSGDFGLLPQLAFDAVMARARSGEALVCAPRLVEMTVCHQLSVVEARQVMDLVANAVSSMSTDQALAVLDTLEAWWLQALQREMSEQAPGFPPAVMLGIIARWDSPMTRWLTSWLEHLDGPGSRYLVDAIAALELVESESASELGFESGSELSGDAEALPGWKVMAPLVSEAWLDLDDKRGQLIGWARSETVVNGLVLIGATHLHCDHYPVLFSEVLDVLLGS